MRTLRGGASVAVLLGLAALIGCKSTEPISVSGEDDKKLDGTWQVVGRTEGEKDTARSKPLPLEEGAVVVITNGVLTTKSGGLRLKVSLPEGKHVDLVEVDEKNKPVQSKKDAEPMTEYRYKGLYKLEGDTLTITLAGENVKDRPAEVGSKGKGQATLVLKKTDGKALEKRADEKLKKDDKTEEKKEEEKNKKDKDKKEPPKSDFGEK
jgi:uncharacterized protein (TIGR03067 family)